MSNATNKKSGVVFVGFLAGWILGVVGIWHFCCVIGRCMRRWACP